MKVSEMRDDQLVEVYIQLRDRRAERKKAFEVEDADDKAKMEKLEQLLLSRFNENGQESVRTKAGTAYKKLTSSCTVADWDSYLNTFVIPNQAWDFLERRANKTMVDAFKTEHQDLPPGLNWSETLTIGVRRS